jgi:hypothetical protein
MPINFLDKEKVMDLCDVPKIWDFEDEVFCYKGVDSVQLVVKRGWFIERWEVEDPRVKKKKKKKKKNHI